MARYVMANRRAGKSRADRARSREATDRSYSSLFARSVNFVGEEGTPYVEGPHIVRFEADPAEVEAKLKDLPDNVILEPAIPHYPVAGLPPTDFKLPLGKSISIPLGTGACVAVSVLGSSGPLANARIQAYFRGPGNCVNETSVYTSAGGQASINHDPGWHLAAIVVTPYSGHWSMLLDAPAGQHITVTCPSIQMGSAGWWHDRAGVALSATARGQGIRVGVIDTGCGSHPSLQHVTRIGAFIGGVASPLGGDDVDSHGTHVCGIIGARSAAQTLGCYEGIAPGCELFSARVFPDDSSPADQGDVVMAMEVLSGGCYVDLINLSLGSPSPSQIEHDAVLDARDRGTLCICAAGNEAPNNPQVIYPAAFPECVAVSALGLNGWAPAGTVSASRRPTAADMLEQSGLFVANFSCHGNEISVAAPGVGIISPIPPRYGIAAPYACMDGTSMASPLACATLAVILANDPTYLGMPKDEKRAEKARQVLLSRCQDLGLQRRYQGQGLCVA